MALRITGTIRPEGGDGLARWNYPVLIPRAAVHCPDVANFGKDGTINVELDKPLDKGYADCWTPRVTWNPVAGADRIGTTRIEAFGFIKIKFECPIAGDQFLHDAWIVFPEGHPFSYEGHGIEIIADHWITGAVRGARCAVHVDHAPAIQRPDWFGRSRPDCFGNQTNLALPGINVQRPRRRSMLCVG
jgi:hypothetical protein